MTPSSSTTGTTFNQQMDILYPKAEGAEQEFLLWLQGIVRRSTVDRLRGIIADAEARPPRRPVVTADEDEPDAVHEVVARLFNLLEEPTLHEIRRLDYYQDLERFFQQSEELSTLIEQKPNHPTSLYIARVCHENALGAKKSGKDLVAQYLTFKAYRCSPLSGSKWQSSRTKVMTQKHAGEILHTICQHFDRSVLLLLPEQSLTL